MDNSQLAFLFVFIGVLVLFRLVWMRYKKRKEEKTQKELPAFVEKDLKTEGVKQESSLPIEQPSASEK